VISSVQTEADIIVVDAGGTKTRLGALRAGVPLAAFRTLDSREFDRAGTAAHAVLASEIRDFAQHQDLHLGELVVGIPGMLDERREHVSHCNNIRAFEGSSLIQGLRAELEVPVLFEQDIMLQLLGEWRAGVARGCESAFGLYFGTGIGSAWLQRGDPFVPRSTCQQAGHIPVAAEGLKCKCGKLDCVEAHASGHTLHALSRRHGVPIETLFEHRGDAELDRSLERFVTWQGFLITTIGMLLEPDMIVVGGGIPRMPGYPRHRLNRIVEQQTQPSSAFHAGRVDFAELDDRGPLLGASVLVELSRSSASPFGAAGSPSRAVPSR